MASYSIAVMSMHIWNKTIFVSILVKVMLAAITNNSQNLSD